MTNLIKNRTLNNLNLIFHNTVVQKEEIKEDLIKVFEVVVNINGKSFEVIGNDGNVEKVVGTNVTNVTLKEVGTNLITNFLEAVTDSFEIRGIVRKKIVLI